MSSTSEYSKVFLPTEYVVHVNLLEQEDKILELYFNESVK